MSITGATALTLRGSAATALEGRLAELTLGDLYDAAGAAVYHDTGSLDPTEIRELVRLVRATSGPVLELAAGSGRLTLPLLGLRRPLTAVELSADMAAILRTEGARARGGDLLEVVEADMSDFDLGRTFGVVALGASSIALLDPAGRQGLYACVRRHLAPGGVFLLSVAHTLETDGGTCDDTYDVRGRSGRAYRMHQFWQPGEEHRTVCVYPLDGDLPISPVCLSNPRVMDRDVVLAELVAAGFTLRAEHPVAGPGTVVRDVFLEVTA